MALNPDEAYRQKAATEPVAPATLWVYPELKRVDPSKQRPVLEEAMRRALRHWLSSMLMISAVAVAAISLFAFVADRAELRAGAGAAWSPLVFTWMVVFYVLTRRALRLKLSPGVKGRVDG